MAKSIKTSSIFLETLTPRERQLLPLLIEGMSNKAIAETLMVSTNTVKKHLKSIYHKLGVSNRANAVAVALQSGINAK